MILIHKLCFLNLYLESSLESMHLPSHFRFVLNSFPSFLIEKIPGKLCQHLDIFHLLHLVLRKFLHSKQGWSYLYLESSLIPKLCLMDQNQLMD